MTLAPSSDRARRALLIVTFVLTWRLEKAPNVFLQYLKGGRTNVIEMRFEEPREQRQQALVRAAVRQQREIEMTQCRGSS